MNNGASAPGRVQPEKATPSELVWLVALRSDPLHNVEGQTGVRRGAGDFENGQPAGNASPVLRLVEWGTGNVVSYDDGACIDPSFPETLFGLTELHPVAGVVPVTEQHPAAALNGSREMVGLAR